MPRSAGIVSRESRPNLRSYAGKLYALYAMIKLGGQLSSTVALGIELAIESFRLNDIKGIILYIVSEEKKKEEEDKNSFDRNNQWRVFHRYGWMDIICIYIRINNKRKENSIVIFQIGLHRSCLVRAIFSTEWVYFGIKQFSRILFVEVERGRGKGQTTGRVSMVTRIEIVARTRGLH